MRPIQIGLLGPDLAPLKGLEAKLGLRRMAKGMNRCPAGVEVILQNGKPTVCCWTMVHVYRIHIYINIYVYLDMKLESGHESESSPRSKSLLKRVRQFHSTLTFSIGNACLVPVAQPVKNTQEQTTLTTKHQTTFTHNTFQRQ